MDWFVYVIVNAAQVGESHSTSHSSSIFPAMSAF
jgi:hypothetical protein